MSGSAPLAADRVRLPTPALVILAITAGTTVALAAVAIPSQADNPSVPIVGAFVAGVLAVTALRSVPVRVTAQLTVVVSALLMLWQGRLPTGQLGLSPFLLAWVTAATSTLVLASAADRFRGGAAAVGRLARLTVVTACSVLAVVLLVVGPMTAWVSSGSQSGEAARFDASTLGSALAASDELTMNDTPRLSDAVVMTVDAPVASFWRTQVFDRWTGTGWGLTDESIRPLEEGTRIRPESGDIAATGGRPIRSEFRIEAQFASALAVLPSAVRVDAPVPVQQTVDGSLITARPLGRGAVYTVVSRRMELNERRVRAAGEAEVPAEIRDRFAVPPATTDRVLREAERLGAANPNPYDLVRAIEDELADRTRYSIEAPPTPVGVDPVDHFLFTSRLGWCEQIASTLTVMLRANGVPARLAVGYAPAQYDPVTGRFVVRERDAHAWTEVWFAGLGWVPFDPTAGVPLSGTDAATGGRGALAAASAVPATVALVLLAGAAVVAVGPALIAAVRRRLRRGARRRDDLVGAAPASDWVRSVETRLDGIGRRWHRPRAPAETAAAYARDLGERSGVTDLAAVGAVVDRERYSPHPATDAEQSAVVAVLDRAEAVEPLQE